MLIKCYYIILPQILNSCAVESEYAELQRQYRALETEKKAYTEKTQIQQKKLEYV